MILGLGIDLVNITRIEQAMARHGERFLRRIFTANERALAESRADPAATYAKRFAAKEACMKALGETAGISWQHIEVTNSANGKPALALHAAAAARLARMMPPGATAQLHLALTDDAPYAQAMVIIEAIHG